MKHTKKICYHMVLFRRVVKQDKIQMMCVTSKILCNPVSVWLDNLAQVHVIRYLTETSEDIEVLE